MSDFNTAVTVIRGRGGIKTAGQVSWSQKFVCLRSDLHNLLWSRFTLFMFAGQIHRRCDRCPPPWRRRRDLDQIWRRSEQGETEFKKFHRNYITYETFCNFFGRSPVPASTRPSSTPKRRSSSTRPSTWTSESLL